MNAQVVRFPPTAEVGHEESWWAVPSNLVRDKDMPSAPLQFGVSLFTSMDTDLMRPVEMTIEFEKTMLRRQGQKDELHPDTVAALTEQLRIMSNSLPPFAHYHVLKISELLGSARSNFYTLQLPNEADSSGAGAASAMPSQLQPLPNFSAGYNLTHDHAASAMPLAPREISGPMFGLFPDVKEADLDQNRGFHRSLDVLHITRLDHVLRELRHLSTCNNLLVAAGEEQGRPELPPPAAAAAVPAGTQSRFKILTRPRLFYYPSRQAASERRDVQLALRWYVCQKQRPVDEDMWRTALMLVHTLPSSDVSNRDKYTVLQRLVLVQACWEYAVHFCGQGTGVQPEADAVNASAALADPDLGSCAPSPSASVHDRSPAGELESDSESASDDSSLSSEEEDASETDDEGDSPTYQAPRKNINKMRKARGDWLMKCVRHWYPSPAEMLRVGIVGSKMWSGDQWHITELLPLSLHNLALALQRQQVSAAAVPVLACASPVSAGALPSLDVELDPELEHGALPSDDELDSVSVAGARAASSSSAASAGAREEDRQQRLFTMMMIDAFNEAFRLDPVRIAADRKRAELTRQSLAANDAHASLASTQSSRAHSPATMLSIATTDSASSGAGSESFKASVGPSTSPRSLSDAESDVDLMESAIDSDLASASVDVAAPAPSAMTSDCASPSLPRASPVPAPRVSSTSVSRPKASAAPVPRSRVNARPSFSVLPKMTSNWLVLTVANDRELGHQFSEEFRAQGLQRLKEFSSCILEPRPPGEQRRLPVSHYQSVRINGAATYDATQKEYKLMRGGRAYVVVYMAVKLTHNCIITFFYCTDLCVVLVWSGFITRHKVRDGDKDYNAPKQEVLEKTWDRLVLPRIANAANTATVSGRNNASSPFKKEAGAKNKISKNLNDSDFSDVTASKHRLTSAVMHSQQ